MLSQEWNRGKFFVSWLLPGDVIFLIQGFQSQNSSCLHENVFDLGNRTRMRMQRFSKEISEFECLQTCENCEAVEQVVCIKKTADKDFRSKKGVA